MILLNFKIGDVVSRKSYNNDIIFEIVDIDRDNDIVTLKGVDLRLYADCSIEDLKHEEKELDTVREDRKIITDNIKSIELNRDKFFFLPYGIPSD